MVLPIGQRRGAFSLLEITVAIGFLGLILLTLVALFTALHKSSVKSSHVTAARAFAESRLSELIRSNTYQTLTPGTSAEVFSTDPTTGTEMMHRVHITSLSASTAPFYTGGYWVELEVWWWTDSAGKGRAGMGEPSLSVGRFVYPDEVAVP